MGDFDERERHEHEDSMEAIKEWNRLRGKTQNTRYDMQSN